MSMLVSGLKSLFALRASNLEKILARPEIYSSDVKKYMTTLIIPKQKKIDAKVIYFIKLTMTAI